MDNKAKIKLLKDLLEYDHAFIGEEECRKFLDPFGIEGGVETFKANPNSYKGLTLNDGQKQARGQDAANIAEMIARRLGCDFYQATGRGFRLRYACEAAIKKLSEKNN